jgi:hypothetical protein
MMGHLIKCTVCCLQVVIVARYASVIHTNFMCHRKSAFYVTSRRSINTLSIPDNEPLSDSGERLGLCRLSSPGVTSSRYRLPEKTSMIEDDSGGTARSPTTLISWDITSWISTARHRCTAVQRIRHLFISILVTAAANHSAPETRSTILLTCRPYSMHHHMYQTVAA